MVRTKTEKLARQLFCAGTKRKREVDGYSDGMSEATFFKRHPNHLPAWIAVAEYVEKNFVRRKRGK